MQNMASGWPAEDSVLMLQADHVDAAEVQKPRGFPVGCDVVLRKCPPYPCRIVISLVGVVYRKRQQSRCSILRRYRAAQVCRERGNPTLPGKIVPNHGDSTRQGWLRLKSWP